MHIPLLIAADDDDSPFPPVELALREPNGLLAFGGNLSATRLLNAYSSGIFPWYSPPDPILWWSPDPRLVLFPEQLHLSRSLRKEIKRDRFTLSYNRAFAEVIQACSEPRQYEAGTWITAEMKQAYINLHHMGFAHSFEAWQDDKLVGGLYGIAMDQVFFGESMFSRRTNASKICFAYAVQLMQKQPVRLIDCQVKTPHLQSLGATEIPRGEFVSLLHKLIPTRQPVTFSGE